MPAATGKTKARDNRGPSHTHQTMTYYLHTLSSAQRRAGLGFGVHPTNKPAGHEESQKGFVGFGHIFGAAIAAVRASLAVGNFVTFGGPTVRGFSKP
jgi:hypothetical protein